MSNQNFEKNPFSDHQNGGPHYNDDFEENKGDFSSQHSSNMMNISSPPFSQNYMQMSNQNNMFYGQYPNQFMPYVQISRM